MAEAHGQKIRIVLRAIQILDNKEAFYKKRGEFRFKARVSSDDNGGVEKVTEFPEEGYFYISAEPGHNWLRLDLPIFEGNVEDDLTVELNGIEHDKVSDHDALHPYRRSFAGSPDSWVGTYGPGDDVSAVATNESDPEVMPDWRIWYKIEKV